MVPKQSDLTMFLKGLIWHISKREVNDVDIVVVILNHVVAEANEAVIMVKCCPLLPCPLDLWEPIICFHEEDGVRVRELALFVADPDADTHKYLLFGLGQTL
jgi:hypothetical protein